MYYLLLSLIVLQKLYFILVNQIQLTLRKRILLVWFNIIWLPKHFLHNFSTSFSHANIIFISKPYQYHKNSSNINIEIFSENKKVHQEINKISKCHNLFFFDCNYFLHFSHFQNYRELNTSGRKLLCIKLLNFIKFGVLKSPYLIKVDINNKMHCNYELISDSSPQSIHNFEVPLTV